MNLTDSSGLVANSYLYDSYGRTLTVSESVAQPYTYTGRELDAESGLYYYRARYYDAQTGRFLNEDPIGFEAGDPNLYRYVFNSPVNFVDPDGEIAFIPIFAGGLIGAGLEAGSQLLSGKVSSCGFDFGAIGKSALLGAAAGGVLGNAGKIGKALFGRGGLLNRGQTVRIGEGRKGGRKVFRITGKLVRNKKIDIKDLGPL